MKLVIQTQYKENYGAHDWDGQGECPQYWKFKGGDTFVVQGVSTKDLLPQLEALIEYNNEASEEYILSAEIMEDDAQVCEEWETPIVLVFDREHQEWTATKVTNNDEMGYMRSEIKMKTEKWTMLEGQERDDYTSQFLMADGQILSYQELEQFFKEAA